MTTNQPPPAPNLLWGAACGLLALLLQRVRGVR
jgi:hypothetical protein